MAGLPGPVTGNSRLKPESLGSARGDMEGNKRRVTREQERRQKKKTGGARRQGAVQGCLLNTTRFVLLL